MLLGSCLSFFHNVVILLLLLDRQSGCHVHTVAARLLQRTASSTSTVHHGAVAAGHECSSASRLQPPVTGPRHTGTDRAALVAGNSSNVVQTVSSLVHSAVVGTVPDYLKNMLYPVLERASQRTL